MSEEIVKYGDIVSIHGLLPKPGHLPEDEIKGLLISKGFTDPNLYFAYGHLEGVGRQELFRVLPKSSFEIHDEAKVSDQGADIESRKEKEVEQFVNNIKLMEGGDIHFGEHLVLNHVMSGSYLKGCFICGEAGFGSFKLQLTREFSSDILFRVGTYRSFQKQGEKLRLKTPFRLQHLRSNSYLNYIQKDIQKGIKKDSQKDIFQDIFLSKQYDDIHPINEIPQPTRRPTVNQSKSQLILWLEPHQRLEQFRVQHQDVVYLQYSKNMGFLTCDIYENRLFVKEHLKGGSCYEALWEVNYMEGGMVFLRHYVFKKVLALDSFGKIELTDRLEKKLLVKAVAPRPQGLESRDLVNLEFDKKVLACKGRMQRVYLNKLVDHCQAQFRYNMVNMCEQQAAQDSFKIIKLEPQSRELIDYLLSSTELLVKLRCFLQIESNVDKLITGFNSFLQEAVLSCLENLCGKLYGCSFAEMAETRNPVSYEVAVRMRDLKIIDMVVDIIDIFGRVYGNLQGIDEFSGKGNEINSLLRVFECSYLMLLHLCHFKDIKIYTSQYLHLFLGQFYRVKEQFVENFLWRILQDNHISISSQISKDNISFAASRFINTQVCSSFIKLIRFFCYCGKQSIRSNQDAVKALLFVPENPYLLKFRLIQGVVCVEFLGKQSTLLDFFHQNTPSQVWNYTYQYLHLLADISIQQNGDNISYVSQNIIAYGTICALLNSPDLRQIDKECQVKNFKRITYPLIRVVHCCYIDVPGFETIRRIAKVREWKDIDKKNVILKSHSAKKKNQLAFINQVLDFINAYLCNLSNSLDFDSSRALGSLLDLLRSTITLGFWDDIEQFRQLIPLLVKVVKYDSSSIVSTVSQNIKGKMVTKSQLEQLVVEKKIQLSGQICKEYLACKTKCLDIIDILMDMETNTRVSLLTFFFKGVYWYTIDFQNYMRPVELEFSCQQEQTKEVSLIGSLVAHKHKKQPDLLENSNLWINKMRELTPIERQTVQGNKKRYLFNRFGHIREVFLALMQLSEYRNYELMNFGLLILSRIFGQRKDLINNFQNVIIVAEGNFNKLSKKSRQQIRSKLKFLEIPNIRELTREKDEKQAIRIWKPYVATQQIQQKKKSGIIQDLCYLIEMMKVGRQVDDNSLKNLYKYDDLGGTLTIYTERELPFALNQKLIKNQDSHLVLLRYIQLINNPDSNQIHLKCLHAIYNYLTMLIWNHPKNKADLSVNLKLVTKHLRWNIGVADFLRQLFKNNKTLIKSDLAWFIELLLDEIRSKPVGDYYRSKLLDIFRMVTLFNDKGVKRNQLEILSAFQRTKFQLLDLSDLSKHLEDYKKNLADILAGVPLQRTLQYFTNNRLRMSPQLTFTTMFFQVFSCLIESRHQVNIGKCSNIHPYEEILRLIELSQGCWPLLRHLRGYVNRLYYIPVDYDILMFEQFVKRELDNIGAELLAYLNDFEVDYERHVLIQFESQVRFTYLASYTYCAFFEVLTSFYSMITKPKFVDHLKNCMMTSTVVLEQVLNLMELFGYMHLRVVKRRAKSKFLMSFLKQIKSGLLTLLECIPLKQMQQRYDKKQFSNQEGEQQVGFAPADFSYDFSKGFFKNFIDMIACHKINKMKKKLIRTLSHKNQRMNVDQFTKKIKYMDLLFTRVIKRFQKYPLEVNKGIIMGASSTSDQVKVVLHQSRSFQVLGKQQLSHDQQNAVLNDIHQKICQNMQNEQIYRRYKDNEFMKFVKLFFQFDKIQVDFYADQWKTSGVQFSLPIVTRKDFVTSVIEMIKVSPDSIKNDSKIQFVRILRLFISETIEEGREKLPVDMWTADYIKEEEKEKLAKSQEGLIEANVHQLIFAIFKQSLSHNLVLLNELLLLTIALLFGGNRVCQQALLHQMMRDKDNLMLCSVEQSIRHLGKQLYSMGKIKQPMANANNFHMTHEDTFDYFNIKDRVMERRFKYQYDQVAEKVAKREKSNALARLFRFLQLLCENNNVEMKKFIRLQMDENGQPRANSVNFIEKTTLLLRKFFKIMNDNILGIPLFLLDFLNEVTQLPCLENQVTFCRSTFLEDLCFMEAFMTPQKRQHRHIESKEDIDRLYEIYNKSVSLVLSNMEGNDPVIFDQIRCKITLQFLQSLTVYNFREILREFQIEPSDPQNIVTDENVRKAKDAIKKCNSLPDCYINLINIISLLYKQNDLRRQDSQESRLDKYFSEFKALERFKKEILRIQINLYSRQYIYFPRYPMFGSLSRQTRKDIMQNVDRDTQRDKLNGLLGYSQEVFDEMEMYQHMSTSGYNYWRSAALYLSFVLQLLVLMSMGIELNMPDESSDFYYKNNFWWICIKVLSVIQMTCSVKYLAEWVRVRSDLAVKKQQRNRESTVLEEEKSGEQSKWRKKLEPIARIWNVFTSLCRFESQFWSIAFFMLASTLGTLAGPQYFALLLIEPFSRIAIMKSIFEAIIFNAKQLLTVSLLGVFFIYTFSLVTLAFNIVAVPDDKQSCDSVIDCVLTIYVSGTISEQMETFEFAKFLAGLIYIVVMELLFSNIVSGIMIDTFAELRDRKKQIIEDMKKLCFICGMSRSQADKRNKDFDAHIKSQHFLWNYIFYIYCLRNKDETDYSGIEYSIAEKLDKEDLSWIPIEEDTPDDPAHNHQDDAQTCLQTIYDKLKSVSRHGGNS